MSHANKITSIVEPTTNVIDWVVSKLKTYPDWHVAKYSGTSYSKIFNHIPELPLPAVVVSYRGSNSNLELPRRSLNFSIIIVTEDVGDFETAAAKSILLIDKAMELLDHEEYNGVLFQFQSDVTLEMPGHSLSAYNLTFHGVDY